MMPGKPLSELPVNSYSIRRTEAEIDEVLGAADTRMDATETGSIEHQYATGAFEALSWLLGLSEQKPDFT